MFVRIRFKRDRICFVLCLNNKACDFRNHYENSNTRHTHTHAHAHAHAHTHANTHKVRIPVYTNIA